MPLLATSTYRIFRQHAGTDRPTRVRTGACASFLGDAERRPSGQASGTPELGDNHGAALRRGWCRIDRLLLAAGATHFDPGAQHWRVQLWSDIMNAATETGGLHPGQPSRVQQILDKLPLTGTSLDRTGETLVNNQEGWQTPQSLPLEQT